MKWCQLEWNGDRWCCDSQGIHAGDCLELRGHKGESIFVRIESSNQGRNLIAFVDVKGLTFTRRIEPEYDELRWP